MYEKGTVIQFNKNHPWYGCIGIIEEAIDYAEEPEMFEYTIIVPIPEKGLAYITVLNHQNCLERIGYCAFMPEVK